MSKKAEIKKIVLDLGGKDINLTIEQAKKLHALLDDIFGEKTVHYFPPTPYPVIIRDTRPYWYFESPTYTWGTSSDTVQMSYTADNQTMCLSLDS